MESHDKPRRIVIRYGSCEYTISLFPETPRDDAFFLTHFCAALREFHGHEHRQADDAIALQGLLYEVADKFPQTKALIFQRLQEIRRSPS